MKRILFSILVVAWISSSTYAENVKLYKRYTYDMPKNIIQKEKNVYDCSKEFEPNALCKSNEKFVGENVELGFHFINNKLISVVIFSKFTSENYYKFIGALNSKFQLLAMESNNKKIDFLEQMKKYQKGIFLKNIDDFEKNGLSVGNLKYIFIDKNTFLKLGRISLNIIDLIMKASNNVRMVEYTITEDDSGAYGLIQFTAPKKSLELLKKKQKYEDF